MSEERLSPETEERLLAALAPRVPVEDRKVALALAQFNRRGRRAFWSERRKGASEEEALGAAEATLR